jgi:hypothetical protein
MEKSALPVKRHFTHARVSPKPVGQRTGFPFDAPSKFILMKPIGGGDQVLGMLVDRLATGLSIMSTILSCQF